MKRFGPQLFSSLIPRNRSKTLSRKSSKRSLPCVPCQHLSLPFLLSDFVQSQFKCPDKVFILDAIPKTATGKIQRRNLAVRLFPFLDTVTHALTFGADQVCKRGQLKGKAVDLVYIFTDFDTATILRETRAGVELRPEA